MVQSLEHPEENALIRFVIFFSFIFMFLFLVWHCHSYCRCCWSFSIFNIDEWQLFCFYSSFYMRPFVFYLLNFNLKLDNFMAMNIDARILLVKIFRFKTLKHRIRSKRWRIYDCRIRFAWWWRWKLINYFK